MGWMFLALLPHAARAQAVEPPLNAQLYRPPMRAPWTLWVEDARRAPDRAFSARLVGVWTQEPLVLASSEEELSVLVGTVIEAGAVAAYSIDRLQLGVHLPAYLRADGAASDGRAHLGDVAGDLRLQLAGGMQGDPAGLALSGRVWAPTSTAPIPLGHDGVAWEVAVAADLQASPTLFAVNLGYRGVPEVPLDGWDWGDALVGRVGIAGVGSPRAGASAEMAVQQVIGASGTPGSTAVEGMLAGWLRLGSSDAVLHLGGGAGMSPGIGAPQVRVVASLGYEPPDRRDSDGDHLDDRVDRCPSASEDADGYQDGDGCPEPTLVRVRLQDDRGRPFPEAEGALLRVEGGDRIEFRGGIEVGLEAGEWLLETRAAGRPTMSRVLTVPEGPPFLHVARLVADVGRIELTVRSEVGALVDAWVRIDDGPPQQARQGALSVALPPGPHRIRAEADGYVSMMSVSKVATGMRTEVNLVLPSSRARLRGERIEIDEKVYFELDRAVIGARSHALLDEVASIVIRHTEIKLLRVEGHTDSRGDEAYNQALSAARAEAVRDYLVAQGVDPRRVVAAGFGESRPVDPAETEAAWEKNRRVEFVVAERTERR